MLASVEFKKRENRDDIEFLQMNGYVPCGIISIWGIFFLPETSACGDKVCQWLATGLWFSPGPPVSSTNKTDRHDISEILLKVALNTIKQANKQTSFDVMLNCSNL